jgi:DNA-binding IclR family transcriptional regulator
MTSKTPPGIQSVEVGGRLLRALISSHGPMNLTPLASAANMPATKARRYLVSFIRLGLVAQDIQTGQYNLGPLALSIGLTAIDRFQIVRHASNTLALIRDQADETTFLSVWGEQGPTIVAFEESRRPLMLVARIGAALPLCTTATGLTFLAFLPPKLTEKQVRREKAAFGPAIKKAFEGKSLAERTAEIRERGFADANEIFQTGISGVSAPVFGYKKELVAAITVVSRPNPDKARLAKITRILIEATRDLSAGFDAGL